MVRRRFIGVLLVVLMILVLVGGCGKKQEPDEFVKGFLDDLRSGDEGKVRRYIVKGKDKGLEDIAMKLCSKISYKVDGVENTGDKVTVGVEFGVVDVQKILDDYNREMISLISRESPYLEDKGEGDIKKDMRNFIEQRVDAGGISLKKYNEEITLIKEKDGWHVESLGGLDEEVLPEFLKFVYSD